MANPPNRQIKLSPPPFFYLLVAFLLLWGMQALFQEQGHKKVSYDEFYSYLEEGKIQEIHLQADKIIAVLKQEGASKERERGDIIVTSRLPGIDETALLEEMRAQKVTFSGEIEKTSWLEALLYGWILPFALIFGVYWFFMRRAGRRIGPLSFGRSRAQIYDRSQNTEKVTFEDVAGVDEAKEELVEIVNFLKDPSRYQKLGARPPKGVLLIGPPGTGKTLLARAVAGESGVPFFSLSGSEFVEMFVGVGASRVRDLFQQAKERAPCIVFIDELDAVGKSRSVAGSVVTHEEREQTLNQLLVEMDGFDAGKGVVILAATNRPEVLDRALLRAGRFDRQVLVDRPDVKGREAILKVHARKIKLASGVDLKVFAQRTPGMSGADLANVVNEAALAAGRRGSSTVEARDFEEAIDRIQLGLKKQGRTMSEEEKRRVAYHEAGHTLIALSVKHADPVHRVTIIPRSIGALGATLQLPTEDRYLMTREELKDRICVMLGGRAAEEVVFQDVSTGAQNDLERVTETARQMVCRFGMSEALGALTFGSPAGPNFLEAPALFGERNFSEKTAQLIDAEVRALVEAEHQRARKILEARRATLEMIAERLLVEETLERADLQKIIEAEGSLPPGPKPPDTLASAL